MLNCMDELQQLWDKALVGAVKNYQSNRATKKSTNKDGGVKCTWGFVCRNECRRKKDSKTSACIARINAYQPKEN